MEKFWLLFIPVLFFLIFPQMHFAKTDENSTRVLFIGNSYTYYHSMPQLFKAMAEHRFPDHQIETKFVGHGGATLKQLWKEGTADQEIQSGEWDFVILQEQSMLGEEIFEDGISYVHSPNQFFEYSRKFVDQIQKNGAEAIFYMTWSRRDHPAQQKYLNYAYMSMAKETGSMIAPVGLIWDSLRTNEAFDLYEFDGSHPSVYGSYTSALMIFSVLFDADPTGIPGRLEGYEILRGGRISKTKRLLCDLSIRNTEFIQNTVAMILDRLIENDGYLKVEMAVSDKKLSQLSKLFSYLSGARGQFVLLTIIICTGILWKVCVILLKK